MQKLIILYTLILVFSCKGELKTSKKEESIQDSENVVGHNIKTKRMTKETIKFPSLDGLVITADVYKVNNNPITILLCHQAGFSRGEFRDTALLLNNYGYSVMAIDQRSGEGVNNVVNETAQLAASKNMKTNYIDAKPDVIAAIDHVYNDNGNNELILLGSSYSATLAMLIGKESNKIKAVVAFSPGEYYKGINVQSEVQNLTKPTFVTASLSETDDLATLVSKMKTDNLTHYKPIEEGIHGSRVLWESTKGYKEYRNAFKAFLDSI